MIKERWWSSLEIFLENISFSRDISDAISIRRSSNGGSIIPEIEEKLTLVVNYGVSERALTNRV